MNFFAIVSSWGNTVEQAVVTNEKRRVAAAKPPPQILVTKKPPGSPATGGEGKAISNAPGEFDSIVKQLKNGSLYRKESVFMLGLGDKGEKGAEKGGEQAAKSPSKKKK